MANSCSPRSLDIFGNELNSFLDISQVNFVTNQCSDLLEVQDGQRKENHNDRCKQHFPLPMDYNPSAYTVIVGKGKESQENLGNKRLRVLASSYLEKYSSAKDKSSKTKIIRQVIDTIYQAGGNFVKHTNDGQWYQVDQAIAREKVSYVFRDLLGDKYRSSAKSKMVQRHMEGKPFGKREQAINTYSIPKIQSKALTEEPVRRPRSTSSLRALPLPSGIFRNTVSCSDTCSILDEAAALILNDDDDFDADELLLSPVIYPL